MSEQEPPISKGTGNAETSFDDVDDPFRAGTQAADHYGGNSFHSQGHSSEELFPLYTKQGNIPEPNYAAKGQYAGFRPSFNVQEPSRSTSNPERLDQGPGPKTMSVELCNQDSLLMEGSNKPSVICDTIVDILKLQRITVKQRRKEYRCLGSYVWHGDICNFEGQLWRLQETDQFVYGLKRKGTDGRIAYIDLVQKVAAELKKQGFARKYANNREIFQPMSEMKWEGLDLDDYDDEKMALDGDVSDFEDDDIPPPPGLYNSFEGAKTGIRLKPDDSILTIWTRLINSNNYGHKVDTYKVIERAAERPENAKVLAGDQRILTGALKELKPSSPAQIVHNVSRFVSWIIECGDAAAEKFLVRNGIVKALTHVALTYSGCGSALPKDLQREANIKKVHPNNVIVENAINGINLLLASALRSQNLLKSSQLKMLKELYQSIDQSNQSKTDKVVKQALNKMMSFMNKLSS